jgi:hypothetical protein
MDMAIAAGRWRTALIRITTLGLLLGAAALGSTARAQDDPPGRVGRVADFNGSVSWWDDESGQWAAAQRNLPLTGGDRVSTADNGRAELRVGSTVLRLGNGTELEVLRLDDQRMVFQLHSGSVALRVRSREIAAELEVVTAEARLLPQRVGLYRVDRNDDVTQAGVWRGELRVGDERGPQIGAGQRAELARRAGGVGEVGMNWIAMPRDGFDAWVMAEDAGDERAVAQRYVSPEMTGAEDLERNGRWEQHPEFGAVWTPLQVSAGWAPYRYGRWTWVAPWGWTWVDDAPWGFAPFHYGRWVSWRDRWCWVPGAYVARPVYAPALVAWVGNAGWGVSVQIGGPSVGWVPLAPREPFRPHYRATPVYVERINPVPPWRWQERRGDGPLHYGNQGVPGGLTVVPGEVLTRRQPVSRGFVTLPERPRGEAVPLLPAQPPTPAITPRRPESGRPAWRGEAPVREQPRPAPQAQAPAPAQPAPQVQPPPPRREPRESRETREPRDAREPRDPRERGEGRDDRRGREAPVPRQQAPAAAPAAPAQAPAAAPAPAAVTAPAAPPAAAPARPPAAERPRERDPERARERDDERKRRPEAQGGMRERENLR